MDTKQKVISGDDAFLLAQAAIELIAGGSLEGLYNALPVQSSDRLNDLCVENIEFLHEFIAKDIYDAVADDIYRRIAGKVRES